MCPCAAPRRLWRFVMGPPTDTRGCPEMGNSRVAHLLDLWASMRSASGLATQAVKRQGANVWQTYAVKA